MKRTSSRIATSCPSMEILKPGLRHPRNPPFAPHSSKHMLIAGGSITFAFSLAGSTAISLQEQGTIPYCRTNSCALRAIQSTPSAGFFYWQLACKAPHLLHIFRVFYPRNLLHFLRTPKDESPSHECSRSHRTARHSASSMSVESPSQG